ncbi:hypothetical protein [Vibrio sp. CAU 1672]|uniref:hypothetical protein n=1 Tax=Vibrio sp. CAU 1672 TaxID=3032594 RepID=UPI0023DC1F2B|nr:hypothetical protein [Vibrio sp. CAU 1672]MDF2154399.1 hypothetical protein [Vibrio sp. CAU 1672]
MEIKQLVTDVKIALSLPKLTISLHHSRSNHNHPFFSQVVSDFYQSATRRHPKFPLIRQLQYGVAVMRLPADFGHYLKALESSARRNIRKAERLGYQFRRIDYNQHLGAIGEIHRSAPVRQGQMPDELLSEMPKPVDNPASADLVHDYPYFGVFKDDKLVAYAGCLVAGDMLLLATVFGHDGYKSDGVVPLLIAQIAHYKYQHYPEVKYYVYDKFFGASPNLRRFKKKFRFEPYVVQWQR